MARTTERDLALSEMNLRGLIINGDGDGVEVTVYPSDSGCIFVNKEDAGTVTYTLPALADSKGKMFWFFNAQTTAGIAVTAPSACMFAPDATATTVTSGATTGACGFVICDGTNYYWFEIEGTWTTS
jgi:hypothetical protein